MLDSADRSINSGLNIRNLKTDDNLEEGWYRFSGAAGSEMTRQTPPTPYRCGTFAPGWLDTSRPDTRLPAQEEGSVQATVCYRWRQSTCQWQNTISINNCGAFFVYKLTKPPIRNGLRYCGSP